MAINELKGFKKIILEGAGALSHKTSGFAIDMEYGDLKDASGIIALALGNRTLRTNAGATVLSFATGLLASTELDMGNNPIKNLADPTNPQEAATKNFVETALAAIDLSVYYTKSEADSLLAAKADKTYVDSQDTATLASANAYTDSAIAAIPGTDLSNYYNKPETDSLLAAKADQSAVTSALALKADKTYVDSQDALLIPLTQKGAANGVAPLDASSLIPAVYLPSYVDDVLEYADLASLPVTGETGKIYVTLDDNKTYRWSGSAYINIAASPGTTDDVVEGSTNLYFTNARAKAAAVVNSTAGSETDQAASVSAMKSYVAGEIAAIPATDLTPYLKKDGSVALTGDLDVNSNSLNQVAAIKSPVTVTEYPLVYVSNMGSSRVTVNSYSLDLAANGGIKKIKVDGFDVTVTSVMPMGPNQYELMLTGGPPLSPASVLKAVEESYVALNLNDILTVDKVSKTVLPLTVGSTSLGSSENQFGDVYSNSFNFSYAGTTKGKVYSSPGGVVFDVLNRATDNIYLDAKVYLGNTNKITGLADGTDAKDAVNKGQLDAAIAAIPATDLTPYLKKDGTVALEGTLNPNATNTIDLGNASARFKTLFANNLDVMTGYGAVGISNFDSLFGTSLFATTGGMAGSIYGTSASPAGVALYSTNKNVAIAAATDVNILASSGSVYIAGTAITLSGIIDANNNAIKNLANPSAPQEAATKNYVDTQDTATLASANSYTDSAVAAIPLPDASSPKWFRNQIGYSTLVALGGATTAGNGVVFTLNPFSVVEAVLIKHSAAFTGSGITGVTVSLGVTGDATKYTSAFDINQAAAGTTYQVSSVTAAANDITAGEDVRIFVNSEGANLNQLTAGQFEFWIKYSQLPTV